MSAAEQVTSIDHNEATQLEGAHAGTAPAATRNDSPNAELVHAVRRRLPDERRSITHHFSIAGQEGYLTVGVYEDGSPGEIFITMSKEGSTISGLMDSFATVVSLALQYGLPLQTLCNKFSHVRFEPSGWSGNPRIGYATSIMDYLFRWLELKFLKSEQGQLFESLPAPLQAAPPSNGKGMVESLGELVQLGDGPVCHICGSLMVRSGSCHRCMTCGSTSGCS
jgi:ribonucleoside-diphosphate reductase alpha chain